MNIHKKENGQVLYSHIPKISKQSLLIKNGRVIDPFNNIDDITNVIIKNGKIDSLSKEIPLNFKPDVTINASNLWVVPGLMDMHVHLREPGQEHKETIETGSYAAAAGGFTSIACMPNTKPVLDNEKEIKYIIERSKDYPCHIYPVGSITKNLDGKEITPIKKLFRAGANAFSDDGKSVCNSKIMKDAFKIAKELNVTLLTHCEDPDLANGGILNEGTVSKKLGVPGIPSISEDVMVARDILIAEYMGAPIHICHVSTRGSVQIIRWAKKRGVKVTCETCPHYFVFIDEDCSYSNTNMKMNPPLRSVFDKKAIIEGLADGTIDVIASDHAPHSIQDKKTDIKLAPFGVIGMETMVGATITYLIKNKILTPTEMIEKMSVNPNKIIGVAGGNLTPQTIADVTIIDPNKQWKVDSSYFYSKSRNTIFKGMDLYGFTKHTILGGSIVYERE